MGLLEGETGRYGARPLRAVLRQRSLAAALGIILLALALIPAVSLFTNEVASGRRDTLEHELMPFVDELEHTQIAVAELTAEANRFAFGGDLGTRQRYLALRDALVNRLERLEAAGERVDLGAETREVIERAEELIATLDEGVAAADAADFELAEDLLVREAPALTIEFSDDAATIGDVGNGRIRQMSASLDALELVQRIAMIFAAGVAATGALVMARMTFSRGRMQRETASERDRAEHERQRFYSMVAATDLGVIHVDTEDRILYVNPAASSLLAYPEHELAGRLFHATVHRSTEEGAPCDPSECPVVGSGSRAAGYTGAQPFIRSDGAAIPVEIRTAPIRIESRTSGAVVVFQDITDRLRREQMQEDFLSLASHELRTPLTSVLGYTSRLSRRAREDPSRFDDLTREEIETLQAAAGRMARTVDLFLDLARLEAGRVAIDLTPFDLASALDEEIDTMRAAYPHVRVRRALSEDPLIVSADEDRVREVVANLLENAARYGGEHPTITVSLDVTDGAAAVSVRDDGPGIPPEDRPHLFERFHRSRTREPGRRSLGVGLYICKQMVDLMGGRIWFTCPPEGGTVFTFTVPLDETQAQAQGAQDDAMASAS